MPSERPAESELLARVSPALKMAGKLGCRKKSFELVT